MKKVLFFLAAMAIIFIAMPVNAKAFSTIVPNNNQTETVVNQDQVINDNCLVAGNLVNVKGEITKDLFGFGSAVEVSGKVDGNAFLGANTIYINGAINGDVYAGGNYVSIGKDAVINGDLITGASMINVNGQVKGKIWAGAEKISFGENAKVDGQVTYSSDNTASIATGAQVTNITQKAQVKINQTWQSSLSSKLMSFLMAFVTGLILILLLSKWMKGNAENLQASPWKSLGWGLLLLIGLPIVCVIGMIIVIGVPASMILLTLYFIAIYIAQIVAGLCLGNTIGKGKWAPIWAMTLGLLIINVLELIPYIGFITGFAVLLFGLGSLGINQFNLIRKANGK